jgi:hypothetical protein
MPFNDHIKRVFPSLYPPTPEINPYAVAEVPPPGYPPQPVPGNAPAPAVAQQLQVMTTQLEPLLGVIEQFTGLSRRELFLQLLKTGVKGGGISGFIDLLQGHKPPEDAKFIRYTRTLALYVPLFVFLMGLSIVGVILFGKFAMWLIGGI